MITINLSPQRSDDTLIVSRNNDILTINNIDYDLGDIPNGATLEDQGAPFVGNIDRDSAGDVVMNLLYPHPNKPNKKQAFPDPILVNKNGKVKLP